MIELGLERIARLLSRTPLPWRAIHVAGTNGKGSVCAYISEMLNTYNRSIWRQRTNQTTIRHGRFTSPHIVDRWDCITLSDGQEMQVVEPESFFQAEREVLHRNRNERINASEFEILTATAFEIFTRNKLDVAVIETGMGGRLDATNIIGQEASVPENADILSFRPRPLVTAITKIGLDHQGFLGDTIEAIAREKAGIFKPDVPVVWDTSNQPSVLQVLQTVAHATKCTVMSEQTSGIPKPTSAVGVDSVLFKTELPAHVTFNCSVAFHSAWLALETMRRVKKMSNEDDIVPSDLLALVNGMWTSPERVHYPGRLEWVDLSALAGKSDVALLDGAHNAQSAEALGVATARMRQDAGGPKADQKSISWVLAASNTKDVKEILRPLLQDGDSVFAVEFGDVDGMPWVKPMTGSDILAAAKSLAPGLTITQNHGRNVRDALVAAMSGSPLSKEKKSNVVVAGSLYLVGEVHKLLRDAQEDRH